VARRFLKVCVLHDSSARSIDVLPDPLTQSDLIGLDAALALLESSRSD